ncbi:tyrosine-protein kinase CSK-like [Artemia franciscana]|uniref:tyrosine-protein kinase CSK-like n=1 Tax=Artemia franciscana TaxID=6661 RepID=UPI0032DA7394
MSWTRDVLLVLNPSKIVHKSRLKVLVKLSLLTTSLMAHLNKKQCTIQLLHLLLRRFLKHYEKDADGLCTHLTISVPKKGKQDFFVDRKAFEEAGWVIQENDLVLRECIGKGEFGDVLLGFYRSERVAVKMLKDTSRAAQKFLAEASVMT